ncbi:MAG: N-6 DNA methylase [Methylotenera sp.]|uniref:Eco57I restriction-modification methylase domain-containing protein n=1 Tax=Methylotenera sp. TaxID=2051956 RepID=UPI00272F3C84|nr:N-6 DNA methylase [Methylotenera sp.]MDP1522105.1 N-6 DNA methylase [Methylotenera sp.]
MDSTNSFILNPKLGQVWTPPDIAMEMGAMAIAACGNSPIKKVLDPACGPATFSKVLHEAKLSKVSISCYDLDERMASFTKKVNSLAGFKGNTLNKDYLADTDLEKSFDLVIMNPPYIRQELIPIKDKEKYHLYLNSQLGEIVDRRSNLFVLFMLKGIVDLKPGGIMCAIVYDAISHSQYGKKALAILNQHAEIEASKHVKAPFNNVLIDAQILVFRKRAVPLTGKLNLPAIQQHQSGTVPLDQLLDTKRGTALLYRKAFLANEADPFFSNATPFFCKQAKLKGLVVKPDSKAYLFESEQAINKKLATWLKHKVEEVASKKVVKLAHSKKAGPLLFNYYVREAPRHLWNPDMVTVSDNFYVSMPKHGFPPIAAWLLLNSDAFIKPILSSGRSQGNGLTKLQVFEYKQAIVPDWTTLTESEIAELISVATTLTSNNASYSEIIKTANKTAERLKLWH